VKKSTAKKVSNNAGERNGRAKLTYAKAARIRVLYETGRYTQAMLAKRYDVSTMCIFNVIHNNTWA
jgi:DNA-binding XRE family transcriptional regulator